MAGGYGAGRSGRVDRSQRLRHHGTTAPTVRRHTSRGSPDVQPRRHRSRPPPRLARVAAAAAGALLAAAALAARPSRARRRRRTSTARPVAAAPGPSTIALDKVADVAQPGPRDQPARRRPRLFIVQQGGRIRILEERRPARDRLPRHRATSCLKRQRAGPAGPRVPPATTRRTASSSSTTRTATATRSSASTRRRRANPDRVATSTRPGRSSRSTSRTPTTTAACSPSGPDGYLYIGMGDGGDGGDPGNRAQDKDSLLGKMLRIDVNRTQGDQALPRSRRPTRTSASRARNEIWQRGLRNPWRFSFDRADRRPADRRRRPGRVGGDRPRAPDRDRPRAAASTGAGG